MQTIYHLLCSLALPSPGVAPVPVPVGHAGGEHLQPAGRGPHQVAGATGADPQGQGHLRQR